MIKPNKSALILVDLQNDFCEGGSLAVPQGSSVIAVANALQPHFKVVVATKDWHPADHSSFASNHPGKQPGEVISLHGLQQVLWPDHCVQGSKGAEFHPDLDQSHLAKIVLKGVDREIDSYSAFYDNEHLRATGLKDYLLSQDIQAIYLMGLATDYCVKYSCLDATELGLDVFVIMDGCQGIDLNPGDVEKAYLEMQEKGITLINSSIMLSKNGQII